MRLHFWVHSGDSEALRAAGELAAEVARVFGSRSATTTGKHPTLGHLIEYGRGAIYDLFLPDDAPEVAAIGVRYDALVADKVIDKVV